ncbi:hypothetical protein [Chryseobacterium daecheongense]|uniref:DUF4878 domain-containing protein n=1 Tax=Chryseobacterium daecheongense TaxID=192389 RepID=A0A3N0VZC6_9FLAO|nr:hypothetical protein [Chryseobacterium daecheongense]ROH98154.1 hypothetical protein EGI05_12520 [Chryseobacterium daecheongense]TDX92643.1 hypothetical protein BCF50_1581 [Chryseobacterium daecheongense]
MRIWTLVVLLSITLTSCNTQASAERKIKRTVTSFLGAVEKNSTNQCADLIKDGHDAYGSIHMQVHFLHKNYKKINSYVNLKKNIKVKDTIYVGTKMKYVQYQIKNSNPNHLQKPLIITFIFYEQIGYDKIFNSSVVENFLDWE